MGKLGKLTSKISSKFTKLKTTAKTLVQKTRGKEPIPVGTTNPGTIQIQPKATVSELIAGLKHEPIPHTTDIQSKISPSFVEKYEAATTKEQLEALIYKTNNVEEIDYFIDHLQNKMKGFFSFKVRNLAKQRKVALMAEANASPEMIAKFKKARSTNELEDLYKTTYNENDLKYLYAQLDRPHAVNECIIKDLLENIKYKIEILKTGKGRTITNSTPFVDEVKVFDDRGNIISHQFIHKS